jgi:transposase
MLPLYAKRIQLRRLVSTASEPRPNAATLARPPGWTAADIAALLHYDPRTVRRWITRHDAQGLDGLPDRPRSGRPRLGSPRLAVRIRALLATPKAWTIARIWRRLGRPRMSLRTMYRRVREQARWCRPRLIAKSDPDHDGICTAIREHRAARGSIFSRR